VSEPPDLSGISPGSSDRLRSKTCLLWSSPDMLLLLPLLQALYRGNAANVLRLVPEVGFKFAVNDQFKIMFAPADGSPLGVGEKLAAGASTGEPRALRRTTASGPSGPV
jgi:hypothetical protein